MNTAFRRNRYFYIALCFFILFCLHLFPTVAVSTAADEARTVLVGGFPIGLLIKPQGVIVVGTAPVETEVGRVVVSTPLLEGDIIEEINGKEINTVEDVHDALKEAPTLSATLKVRRGADFLTL